MAGVRNSSLHARVIAVRGVCTMFRSALAGMLVWLIAAPALAYTVPRFDERRASHVAAMQQQGGCAAAKLPNMCVRPCPTCGASASGAATQLAVPAYWEHPFGSVPFFRDEAQAPDSAPPRPSRG